MRFGEMIGLQNQHHSRLWLAIRAGVKWAEYLPLLKAANQEARWFAGVYNMRTLPEPEL